MAFKAKQKCEIVEASFPQGRFSVGDKVVLLERLVEQPPIWKARATGVALDGTKQNRPVVVSERRLRKVENNG